MEERAFLNRDGPGAGRAVEGTVLNMKWSGVRGEPKHLPQRQSGVKNCKQGFTTEAQRAQRKQGLTEESGRKARLNSVGVTEGAGYDFVF